MKKGTFYMMYNFKLIKRIICIILIIVILFIAQIFYGISYVPTESMEPSIPAESLVLSQKNVKNPQVGEVYIYENGDKDIIHRIIGVEVVDGERKYQFKGDNNKNPDALLVSAKDIKAKYIAHSVILGKIYKYFKTLITAICCFFGIYFLVKGFKNEENKDYDTINPLEDE